MLRRLTFVACGLLQGQGALRQGTSGGLLDALGGALGGLPHALAGADRHLAHAAGGPGDGPAGVRSHSYICTEILGGGLWREGIPHMFVALHLQDTT